MVISIVLMALTFVLLLGMAGLMGNLKAESGLEPICLEATYRTKLGMTSAQYVKAVDDGSYQLFGQDGAGFGLAQWSYESHKQNLLTFARYKGTSIGNLDMQLEFLQADLNAFSAVLGTLKILGISSAQYNKDKPPEY